MFGKRKAEIADLKSTLDQTRSQLSAARVEAAAARGRVTRTANEYTWLRDAFRYGSSVRLMVVSPEQYEALQESKRFTIVNDGGHETLQLQLAYGSMIFATPSVARKLNFTDIVSSKVAA